MLLPALAQAQSDDPCFDALGDDTEALDQYDALVGEYLDASAASDSPRQVEVLDELIGMCQANLRLYAFRANARVATGDCQAARQDYTFVLERADSWPHADNGADARAIAERGLVQAESTCPVVAPTTTGDTVATDDGTGPDAAGTDATTPPGDATTAQPAGPQTPAAPVDDSALVLGLNLAGGIAWASVDDSDGAVGIDSDPVSGVGGGGQFFATYQFVRWFGIGGTVRFNAFRHESEDDGSTRSTFMPSFAPLVRFRTTHFVANLWAGLFLGTFELEGEADDGTTGTVEFDLAGFEVGTFLGYPFEPWSFGTLELGVLLAVRNGTASQSEEGFFGFDVTTLEVDFGAFDLSLGLQGTFEIGL